MNRTPLTSRGTHQASRLRQHAFTLLEMIVTISIMAIIATMFAVNFGGESLGQELRKPSATLQRMAMTANRQSAAFRDEYRITFFQDSFFLSRAPISERLDADEIALDGFVIGGQPAVNLEIRRIGNPKWLRPDGVEWLFQPAGLCEPLEVRLSSNDGYIEMIFNPMTATVDEERSVFQ